MTQSFVALPIPKAVHPVVTKWTENFELHLLPFGVGITREWVSLSKNEAMKRQHYEKAA